jgi:hypothetical protein
MPLNKYHFKCEVIRKDRKVTREGYVEAKWPMDALDQIVEMAVETWQRPLVKIELFELMQGGELVARTTIGERVNAVLATNERLRPSKYKHIREARERRAEEAERRGPALKPSEMYQPKKPHPQKWTWAGECGTNFVVGSYAVLKLRDGKVQHLKGAET